MTDPDSPLARALVTYYGLLEAAHLAVLARDEAERLKAELLSGRATPTGETEAGPRPTVIWQAGLGDLVFELLE